ncbi:hypothetical protein GCM10022403_057330 [Streptomyces coacervatus]|uniref:Transposase n=1 Tax=Streptomyces coacervatus TaxID=647381 RepID=A0ABP7IE99_9ACTN
MELGAGQVQGDGQQEPGCRGVAAGSTALGESLEGVPPGNGRGHPVKWLRRVAQMPAAADRSRLIAARRSFAVAWAAGRPACAATGTTTSR